MHWLFWGLRASICMVERIDMCSCRLHIMGKKINAIILFRSSEFITGPVQSDLITSTMHDAWALREFTNCRRLRWARGVCAETDYCTCSLSHVESRQYWMLMPVCRITLLFLPRSCVILLGRVWVCLCSPMSIPTMPVCSTALPYSQSRLTL
jgi:hypothetical protein